MTTDNGAVAAVAEPEVTPSIEEQTPVIPAPEEGAVVADASAAAPEAESEADASVDDSFDFDAEVAKRSGTDASAPVEKPQLPGRTAAEAEYANWQRDQQAVNDLLRGENTPFVRALQEQYGFDGAHAQEFWEKVQRPLLQRAAALPDRGVNNRLLEALGEALPEEEYAPLFADGREYANRHEFMKAVRESVRAAHEAEWQAKKGKDWLPIKDARELSATAASRAEARTKRMLEDGSNQSGQNAEGRPNRTNEPKSLEEARQMHAGSHPSGRVITNDQMRTYKARFERVT